MEKDRTETRNLSEEYPETVLRLEEAWGRWAEKVGYDPEFSFK